jgi:hypothetical protein
MYSVLRAVFALKIDTDKTIYLQIIKYKKKQTWGFKFYLYYGSKNSSTEHEKNIW